MVHRRVRANAPVLTEPYHFAQANVVGVSAGVPLRRGGVIGFDFTLSTLSGLIGDYRITPNSIIMLASETGVVFMESEACKLENSQCLPGEEAVRAPCAARSPSSVPAASGSSAISCSAGATIGC